MQDVWVKGFTESPDAEVLGWREKLEDGTHAHEFTWMTFSEVETVSNQLGSGMVNYGFSPKPTKPLYENHSPQLIAVWSANTAAYVQFDAACALYGFTSVPIYETLGAEAIDFMFEQTGLDTIFLTINHIKGMKELFESGKANTVKHLVIMDDQSLTFDDQALLHSITGNHSVKWHTFNDVMKSGKKISPTKNNLF